MRIPWGLIVVVGAILEVLTLGVAANYLFGWGIGQHLVLNPILHDAMRDHPAECVTFIVFLAILIALGRWRQREVRAIHPQAASSSRTASVGAGSIQGTAIAGDNNVVNNDGVLNEIYQRRNKPMALAQTMRVVDRMINVDADGWIRTIGSDGTFVLRPSSPEAARNRPLRIETEVQLPNGASLKELIAQAVQTQESITIDGASVKSFQAFLGDTPLHDEDVETKELVITPQPLGPPANYILTIPETGAELKNLELGLFMLPDGRLRLTNRQQQGAPIIVSIDFDRPPVAQVGDDEMVDTGHCTLHIETQPGPGRTVRQMLALYDVLRSLGKPRHIHICDYATSELRFVAYGALPHALHPFEEALANVLAVLQDADPTRNLAYPESVSAEEVRTILEVDQILRTGEIRGTTQGMTITLDACAVDAFLLHMDEDGTFRGLVREEQGIVVLFGQPLDLGKSTVEVCPLKLTHSAQELRAKASTMPPKAGVEIDLVPADAHINGIVRRFSRYLPQGPRNGNKQRASQSKRERQRPAIKRSRPARRHRSRTKR